MGVITNLRTNVSKLIAPKEERFMTSLSGQPANFKDYQSLWSSWFGGYENKAKIAVTPESSLTLSAVYGAVSLISSSIAKLPFKVLIEKTNGDRIPNLNHPVSKIFRVSPNSFCTPFTFVETMMRSVLLRGNAYAWIERDSNAKPINLYWLRNEGVNPILVNRKMFYVVEDTQAQVSGTFSSEDIFHLRGMGTTYIGQSVVSYASESFGKAIATQQFGASFFGSSGVKMILQFLGVKDENKMKQAKQSVIRSYEEDGVAAVNQDVKIEKINIPNNDAQFIESQEFNVADIARWFNIPLVKLQKDTTAATEYQEIAFVNDCLLPWIVRIQQEIEAKLFREDEKAVLEAKFFTDILLKGDSAAQESRIRAMFATGAWSQNQILRFMDYNTIGPQGDEHFLPVNMIPQSQVEAFWEAKDANSNNTQKSGDSSGSGNVNANINL